MRLEIRLRALQSPIVLPASYSYLLTSLIYHTLQHSSQSYATFLHEHGYGAERPFKLFAFSPLLIPDRAYRYEGTQLKIRSPTVRWQITSPMREFVEHLAQGLLSRGRFELGTERARTVLQIEQIEILASPVFATEMQFRSLSPLVVSVSEERNGRLMPHYLRWDEPGWSERLRANLLKKYELVHGGSPASSELAFEFERAYLARVGEKAYKLIDFKGTKIKGVLAPFRVQGSPKLIEMGYEAGFGEKNSMGFGMVAIIPSGMPEKERDHVSTATQ
jgi:CRISPR-associated endoribonuclease Cas6